MRPPSRNDDAHARTPSSAMLVQLLFVVGAVGTGVTAALVTWLGGGTDETAREKREQPEEHDR